MAKRKPGEGNDDDDNNDDDHSSSSDASVDLVDVSFDFFDPNPSVDYAALKRLMTQLFSTDADLFHLHYLTELILSQPTIGTTVKTNGIDSDPYALLTVLNVHVHRSHPSISALLAYALEKSSSPADAAFHSTLQSLLSQPNSHLGLILCERLLNMPPEVIPPMYTMLTNELKWAIDDGEPYTFSHLLFVSRTYHLTPDEESRLFNSAPFKSKPPSPKKKRSNASPAASTALPTPAPDGVYPFHPEDEHIKTFATHILNYQFTSAPPEPREKDSFGLDTRGCMMILPADRFPDFVAKIGEVYKPPN